MIRDPRTERQKKLDNFGSSVTKKSLEDIIVISKLSDKITVVEGKRELEEFIRNFISSKTESFKPILYKQSQFTSSQAGGMFMNRPRRFMLTK
jgi:transcription antitermination factor NusA-like protein